MRLREPFAGYMLSSGHFMFHMAFLMGSYIAHNWILKGQEITDDQYKVLFQLNCAHFLTPISNFVSMMATAKGWNVTSKLFDTFSIFQYQVTIFYAQYTQINSPSAVKLQGMNIWFIIEILSFYGYISSAMFYVMTHQILSIFGKAKELEERKNHDFIKYHRKDLDWLAFVWILLTVNIGLILLDSYILDLTYSSQEGKPLKSLMMQLLVNHLLQFIFLREFYDKNHRVQTKHKWVWVVHALNYPYICYVYFTGDAFEKDKSTARRMWIPLDIILTVLIVFYQIYYRYMEIIEDRDKAQDQVEILMSSQINS